MTDPTLATLRERPCDCGLVQVYGGVPWGVEHAPKCAALTGPSKDELRQALDAMQAERDALVAAILDVERSLGAGPVPRAVARLFDAARRIATEGSDG